MPGIHYTEHGNGFPVVLIHGFCEDHSIWKHIVPGLSDEFRVITIDLPGFGESAPLQNGFRIDDVADAALDFISNVLKINSCIALGHSLGGYVVLAMTNKRKSLFAGLGLIHSTANADLPERKMARDKVIEFVSAHGVDPFVESFIPPLFFDPTNPAIPEAVKMGKRTPALTLLTYTEAMRDRPDRKSILSDYNNPVLFLAGAHDTIIPLESVQAQVLQTKKPILVVLEKTAHMGLLEQVSETTEAILSFVRHVASHSGTQKWTI